MISAAVTGACCLMLGRFRLANLVRIIPYPVAGGFVAGIGGAVCLAALSLMGAEAHWRTLPALLEPSVLGKWCPGAAYGIPLYLAMNRWNNPLILSLSVALAVSAYHLARAALWHFRGPGQRGRPGACGLGSDGPAGRAHADAGSGRVHLHDHESHRPGVGDESGTGLGPRVQGDGVASTVAGLSGGTVATIDDGDRPGAARRGNTGLAAWACWTRVW